MAWPHRGAIPSPAHHPNSMNKTYKEYLQSEGWQHKKSLFYQEYPEGCWVCGSTKNLKLHHKTYERVFKERLTDLVCLCDDCHAELHKMIRRRKKKNRPNRKRLLKAHEKLKAKKKQECEEELKRHCKECFWWAVEQCLKEHDKPPEDCNDFEVKDIRERLEKRIVTIRNIK